MADNTSGLNNILIKWYFSLLDTFESTVHKILWKLSEHSLPAAYKVELICVYLWSIAEWWGLTWHSSTLLAGTMQTRWRDKRRQLNWVTAALGFTVDLWFVFIAVRAEAQEALVCDSDLLSVFSSKRREITRGTTAQWKWKELERNQGSTLRPHKLKCFGTFL